MQRALKYPRIAAERTHDIALIRDIVGSMWSDIAEDGQLFEDFTPECVEECWLNINDMAVWCFHAENSTTLDIHVHILKAYRGQSVEIGYAMWEWFMNHCPGEYEKINCTIPVIHPNVKAYAELMGMVQEGVNRKSYCKNGEIIDQWMMGITRTEVEEFMQ